MDLANTAAALKSKRGAAFSVASIAGDSIDLLAPHVATLLPKLYRLSCALSFVGLAAFRSLLACDLQDVVQLPEYCSGRCYARHRVSRPLVSLSLISFSELSNPGCHAGLSCKVAKAGLLLQV